MQKAGGGLIDTGDAEAETYHKVKAVCTASQFLSGYTNLVIPPSLYCPTDL